jgi:hypothetical protein
MESERKTDDFLEITENMNNEEAKIDKAMSDVLGTFIVKTLELHPENTEKYLEQQLDETTPYSNGKEKFTLPVISFVPEISIEVLLKFLNISCELLNAESDKAATLSRVVIVFATGGFLINNVLDMCPVDQILLFYNGRDRNSYRYEKNSSIKGAIDLSPAMVKKNMRRRNKSKEIEQV